jgi:hypothetical protein
MIEYQYNSNLQSNEILLKELAAWRIQKEEAEKCQ